MKKRTASCVLAERSGAGLRLSDGAMRKKEKSPVLIRRRGDGRRSAQL